MANITKLPAHPGRVETGPVQFGDDWPGVFIRGDRAGWLALKLGETSPHPSIWGAFLLAIGQHPRYSVSAK